MKTLWWGWSNVLWNFLAYSILQYLWIQIQYILYSDFFLPCYSLIFSKNYHEVLSFPNNFSGDTLCMSLITVYPAMSNLTIIFILSNVLHFAFLNNSYNFCFIKHYIITTNNKNFFTKMPVTKCVGAWEITVAECQRLLYTPVILLVVFPVPLLHSLTGSLSD
jgi:hypothetical protein